MQPVVTIKDKKVVSNEFIGQDDLKSQQNEIEEKLGQVPVEPEQKVLVREDTEDNRGRINDVIKEDKQKTSSPAIGVLVIACNRPTVGRALDLLLK